MKADYVDRLYGVPSQNKKFLREELNRAAALAERNVVPLRKPLSSPEGVLFEATQEAEKYLFRQLRDYFFHKNIPYLIIAKIVGRLEEIQPTIDDSPQTVDRIRDEVLQYVNFVARGYLGIKPDPEEIPTSYLVENLDDLVESLVRYPRKVSDFDLSVFSVVRDITYLLVNAEKQARILPFRP